MRLGLVAVSVGVLAGAVATGCGGTSKAPPKPSAAGSGGEAASAGSDPGGAEQGGQSGAPGCAEPSLECPDVGCVDVSSDAAHCGSCDKVCPTGASCDTGECSCAGGQTECGTACVDLQVDVAHCGDCAEVCPTGSTCTDGACSHEDGCTAPAKGISISKLELYQSVPTTLMADGVAVTGAARKVDVVAGRESFLRVFLEADAEWEPHQLSARLQLSDDAGQPPLEKYIVTTPLLPSVEETLGTTLNLLVPGDALTASARYRVELADCGKASGSEAKPRFPESGWAPLEARDLGELKIALVPIGVQGGTAEIDNVAFDGYRRYLEALYPVKTVTFTVLEPMELGNIPFDFEVFLDALRDRRADDAPADELYYVGVSPDPDPLADGLGFVTEPDDVDLRAAVVFLDVNDAEYSGVTIAHELGHNHGLMHSPGCDTDGADFAYPYPEAKIGIWGFDRRSAGLLSPQQYFDLETYCTPRWFSDYTYQPVLERIAHVNGVKAQRKPRPRLDARMLLVTPGGAARWGRPFHGLRPLRVAESAIVLDSQGQALTNIAVYRLATSSGGSHLVVPRAEPGWAALQLPGMAAVPFE